MGACTSTKGASDPPAGGAAAGGWKIGVPPTAGVLVMGLSISYNVVPLMLFGIKHMGDKYKFQVVDIRIGDQKSADFLAVNPFHQVAAGKASDGTCFFELSSSLRYLATKYAPETYPAEKQLQIDIAMDKRQSDVLSASKPIGLYSLGFGGAPPVEAAAKLTDVLTKFEKAFLTGKFIGGDAPCIADYSMAPLVFNLNTSTVKKIGYTLPERWLTYVADLSAALGDSWTASMKEHGDWVGAQEEKVESVPFDPYKPEEAGTATWSIESPPADGVLVVGHPGSGNVIPFMIFGLKHMGDKYKFQMCDVTKGEQNTPDFLAVNPFHQVPSAKTSDGICMFEVCACLRYMAKKYAPETYPTGQHLQIDMAMDKRQGDFYDAFKPIAYHALGLSPAPPKDAASKLNDVLSKYEKAFLKGKFIGGDMLCIADYALAPLIFNLSTPTVKKIGYTLPDRYATYLADVSTALGDVFTEAGKVHDGWVASNLATVETVAFDK